MANLTVLAEFEHEYVVAKDGADGRRKIGKLYCPSCNGPRSVLVKQIPGGARLPTGGGHTVVTASNRTTVAPISPSLPLSRTPVQVLDAMLNSWRETTPRTLVLECVECETLFTAVIYQGPSGRELVILPSREGAYTPEGTPEPVRYYLEQARRAELAGAASAAVAMYRAALEHLLVSQGFTPDKQHSMLGGILRKVEEAQADPSEDRAWVRNLDTGLMRAFKEIADGAVHSNGGDIALQAEIDADLLRLMSGVFSSLLVEVIEKPRRDDESKRRIQEAAATFNAAKRRQSPRDA